MPQIGFKRNEVDGVVFYTIPSFEKEGIKHLFTTRIGGVSKGCYESLNLSLNRYDRKEEIYQNFHRICGAGGFDYDALVLSDQVHGDRIVKVGVKDKGKGLSRESDITNADGLMTCDKGVTLVTFYADCVPLFFYDRVNKAIALSHSGWKGTALRIAQKTLAAMGKEYGTKPEDCIVAIGPSIGICCYEVGDDVIRQFQDIETPTPVFQYKGNGKWMLDLQKINYYLFTEAGVPDENITISGICTSCNHDFYSYRRDRGITGSMAAFMQL